MLPYLSLQQSIKYVKIFQVGVIVATDTYLLLLLLISFCHYNLSCDEVEIIPPPKNEISL